VRDPERARDVLLLAQHQVAAQQLLGRVEQIAHGLQWYVGELGRWRV
jgi:hypothetical protein